jgi:hypothetical protein
MTPKEKAIELVDKFYQRFPLVMDVITTRGDLSWEYNGWKEAKQCALIAVDELIYETQFEVPNIRQRWWIEVKKEIELL